MDQNVRPSRDLLRLLAAAGGEGHRPQQATSRPAPPPDLPPGRGVQQHMNMVYLPQNTDTFMVMPAQMPRRVSRVNLLIHTSDENDGPGALRQNRPIHTVFGVLPCESD